MPCGRVAKQAARNSAAGLNALLASGESRRGQYVSASVWIRISGCRRNAAIHRSLNIGFGIAAAEVLRKFAFRFLQQGKPPLHEWCITITLWNGLVMQLNVRTSMRYLLR